MSRKPSWSRLSNDEFKKRILALESEFGQKNLAQMLGVSRDSIRRYRTGTTFPQTKDTYQIINRLYNQKKNLITPEKIERKQKQIKKQSNAQKYGRIKSRYASVYPDYMYNSPAKEFEGVKNWDKLEELSEKGYVAGWKGRDIIPLEVQFLLGEDSLKTFGKIVRIVGIITRMNSPKADNNYSGQETELVFFPTYYRLIPGLKKEDSPEARHDKIRSFFIDLNIERGYTLAYLGYFFEEGDEI